MVILINIRCDQYGIDLTRFNKNRSTECDSQPRVTDLHYNLQFAILLWYKLFCERPPPPPGGSFAAILIEN